MKLMWVKIKLKGVVINLAIPFFYLLNNLKLMNKILIRTYPDSIYNTIQFYNEEESAYDTELNSIIITLNMTQSLNIAMSMITTENEQEISYTIEFKQSAIYDLIKVAYSRDPFEAKAIAFKLADIIIAEAESIPSYNVLGYANWSEGAKKNYNKAQQEEPYDFDSQTIEALGGNPGDDIDDLLTSLGRD